MAPQNLNMELLLTSQLAGPNNNDHSKLILEEDSVASSLEKNRTMSWVSKRSTRKQRERKKIFQHFTSMTIEPFTVIQSLLTPGRSAACCNEETLSSSFLLLDGILTISLVGDNLNCDDECFVEECSRGGGSPNQKYDLLTDASERWGARMETNISVGQVCYEYQYESEEAEEKFMSNSSSECKDDQIPLGTILSQKLDIVPLVLDNPSTLDVMTPSPHRYIPPSHKMVADCLKFKEYEEATEVYLDILKADQERYGKSDLMCAVDYHNLGVTSVLSGDLEGALKYFQESVILKRACFEENDTTVADSLVEIGIILYNRRDLKGALNFFHEALEIYFSANGNTESCTDSIGRTYNNIGCVHYQLNEIKTSLLYLQKSLVAQRNVLGLNSKAESALLNYALTQANTGYLKSKAGHLDATALMEDSLLVLESVLGDDNMTVSNVRRNILFDKQ